MPPGALLETWHKNTASPPAATRMAELEGERDVNSDEETDEKTKKLEDAYAAEFEEDDYGMAAPGKRKREEIEKPANPGWCLLVQLKFKDMGRVMKVKDLVGKYAAWIKKNEPTTLSYSLIFSDKDPLTCTLFERYTDKPNAYLKVHKTSKEFEAFRPQLAALEPEIDGHSYYEDLGFMSR